MASNVCDTLQQTTKQLENEGNMKDLKKRAQHDNAFEEVGSEMDVANERDRDSDFEQKDDYEEAYGQQGEEYENKFWDDDLENDLKNV